MLTHIELGYFLAEFSIVCKTEYSVTVSKSPTALFFTGQ